MEYKANVNNRLGIDDEEAQLIGEAFEDLEKQKGGSFKTEDIVEVARDPNHIFHQYIWSMADSEAAYAHRLTLARHLKASVRYVEVTISGPVSVPVHTSIPVTIQRPNGNEDNAPAYVPTPRILSDPELREKAWERLLHRIYGYRDEISIYPYKGAAGIVRALDAAIAELEKGLLVQAPDGQRELDMEQRKAAE